MKPRRRRARAFVLVELMVVTLAATALAGVLFVTLNEGLYLQRTVAAHADRTATVGALTRQVRRDVLAATGYRWDGNTLVLQTVGAGARRVVRYAVGTDAVVRAEDGAETHVWQAKRLEFAARVEHGPQADVFLIDLTELAPPRARVPSPRECTASFLLPPQAEEGRP